MNGKSDSFWMFPGFNLCFNQPIEWNFSRLQFTMSVTIAAKVGVRTVFPPLGFVWKWGIPLKWQYKKEHNTGTIGDKPSTLGLVYFQTNSFRGNVHPENDDTPGFVFGVWGYPILMPYTRWSSAITRTSRIERHRAEEKRSENGASIAATL